MFLRTVIFSEPAHLLGRYVCAGKRKKALPKTPEEQFFVLVEQVANYMLDHMKKVCQPAVPLGNMNAQYLVLGSLAVIKSRLCYYRDLLRLPSSK